MPHPHRSYDDEGVGLAVILLHGFPFNRSMWREQIDFLSAHGCRAVAPNLLEMSAKLQLVDADAHESEWQRQAEADRTFRTMESMARDVSALMDELKIDQAVICGLSMGAYVAFEFVHLFPSRVRAFVLAGARAQGPDESEKQSREQQARRILTEGMAFVADAMLSKVLAPRTLAEKPTVVSRVREMILRTDPRGAAAAQRGMAARHDYSNDLTDIVAPTLIIAGREDAIRKPEDAEFISRGIRNSHLEIIDDAGHLMNMEQADVFNRLLLSFMGEPDPA
jgi:3-oxoadipate enol-lactonase